MLINGEYERENSYLGDMDYRVKEDEYLKIERIARKIYTSPASEKEQIIKEEYENIDLEYKKYIRLIDIILKDYEKEIIKL